MSKRKYHLKYEEWLNLQVRSDVDELNQCKTLYKELIDKNRDDLDLLALLEETINQIRCREVSGEKYKLSSVRGYIYVRAPFHGMQNKNKDIRTVVGKTSDHGDDLNKLMYDPEFTLMSKSKIYDVMTKKIEENLNNIKELKEKILSL